MPPSASPPSTQPPRSSGSVAIELLSRAQLGSRLITWAELAATEHRRAVADHHAVKAGVVARIGRSLWDDFGANKPGPAA